MCGRYTMVIPPELLRTQFDLEEMPLYADRYNITPGQLAAVIRNQGDHNRLVTLKWGLVPAWSKDPGIGSHMINAHCGNAVEKPAFRHAIKYRRCIIPASGFYEWQPDSRHGKQPWLIRMADESPLWMAGLWESWRMPDGSDLETFAILTTAANSLVAPIHDSMPVLLTPDSFTLWLSHNMHDPELLQPLYSPFPSSQLTAYKVADLISNPHYDSPDCIAPLEE